MRRSLILLLGIPALVLLGCSNSGTSGPETMTVELDVLAVEPFHNVSGAKVIVLNLTAVTDTSGSAVIKTDINTLHPTQTYQIYVTHPNFTQAFPDQDTVIVPSAPNNPSGTGYILSKTVQMKMNGE